MSGKASRKRAIRIHFADNVATVLDDLRPGDTVEIVERDGTGFGLQVLEPIPFGHKVALEVIGRGRVVVKYGASIGMATKEIQTGQHVHIHNLSSNRGRTRGDRG